MDNHSALEHVGALIEYPGLYPYLTGREQLLLFANGPQRHERVNQTIEELHLAAYADVKTKNIRWVCAKSLESHLHSSIVQNW